MLRVKSFLSDTDEKLVAEVIDCGFTVHASLGPGFRERIYNRAFCLELQTRRLSFETEKRILVRYKHWEIPGQQVDLVVGGVVLVELKAVPQLRALHHRQVLSYLKTMGLRVGLLMNFNVELFKQGVKRIVH